MLSKRFRVAESAIKRSGKMLRETYQGSKSIQHKGRINLLTEYDIRSEAILIEAIREAFPNDAIVAEESQQHTDFADYWLIDPIDGTTNFAHGLPEYAICVAYMKDGEPVIGLIYNPARDELYHAMKGEGAYLNDDRVQVSNQKDVSQCLLSAGFPYDPQEIELDLFDKWAKIFYRSRGIRHIGCASMNAAYIASGCLDGYWEQGFQPWDLAAGILIVSEAGGKVTRINGEPNPLMEPCSILATNGLLHAELLELLSSSK